MKAMIQHAKAILYAPQPLIGDIHADVLRQQGVQVRRVQPGELHQTLDALLHSTPAAGAAGTENAPGEPFLVLCHCSSSQIGKVLQALRAPGIPPLPLKATLTPTNLSWTALQLYKEISEEHAQLHGRTTDA